MFFSLVLTPARSAAQFAGVIRDLVEAYPLTHKIHLVMDNPNIHCRKSLRDRFGVVCSLFVAPHRRKSRLFVREVNPVLLLIKLTATKLEYGVRLSPLAMLLLLMMMFMIPIIIYLILFLPSRRELERRGRTFAFIAHALKKSLLRMAPFAQSSRHSHARRHA